MSTAALPTWAQWNAEAAATPFTVGIEEEVMLVDAHDRGLACRVDEVLTAAPRDQARHIMRETHGCAVEIATTPHATVSDAVAQLRGRRAELASVLADLALVPAVAGTHPFATWQDVEITAGAHQREVASTTRVLARREPTFALHVHVAVPDGETAIRAMNRMRAHLPLLLALSGNSPFWQGRDSGLASVRTPLFHAFPRTGLPRAFTDYGSFVAAVRMLVDSGAIPDPSFIWWDLRLQPALGTLEIRVMDAQTDTWATAALAELTLALVRAECSDEGLAAPALVASPEVLIENRFLAMRDGVWAQQIDPDRGCLVEMAAVLDRVLCAVGPVDGVERLFGDPPAARQRAVAGGDLTAVLDDLIARY